MLEEQLKKFGLPDEEARIYIALLELGTAKVSEVAKKAKINRSNTYIILEALRKKELSHISDGKKIRSYNPAPPERLIQLLEERLKKNTELLDVAHNILPELKSIYIGSGPKPKIRFYEGREGIKTVYEDTLTSSETIRAYASIENMHAALPNYFPEYYKRRAAKGIHIRAIFPNTDEAKERITHNKEEERTALLVPKEEYNFSSEINFYDNKIAFMSLREKFGVIIESEELVNTLKKMFELSWVGAEKLDKELKHDK